MIISIRLVGIGVFLKYVILFLLLVIVLVVMLQCVRWLMLQQMKQFSISQFQLFCMLQVQVSVVGVILKEIMLDSEFSLWFRVELDLCQCVMCLLRVLKMKVNGISVMLNSRQLCLLFCRKCIVVKIVLVLQKVLVRVNQLVSWNLCSIEK